MFSLTIVTEQMYKEADYLGLISYNLDENKLDVCGLKTYKSPRLDVPLFDYATLSIECVLKSVDEEHGCIYARIVRCECPNEMLTSYRLDYTKVDPVFYDPANRWYYSIGRHIGCAKADGKEFFKRGNHKRAFTLEQLRDMVYGPNRAEDIANLIDSNLNPKNEDNNVDGDKKE